MIKSFLSFLIVFSLPNILSAQSDKTSKTDSVSSNRLKAFREVIAPGAVTKRGLFTVHRVNDKYYFEIGDNLFGKDLLVVSRIDKGASALPLYSGDAINNIVVRFEKGPGNKLFLRKLLFTVYTGDSTSPMYNAIVRSNLMPIIASFPILAVTDKKDAVVVDVTNYVLGDNELFSFNGPQKKQANLAGIEADKGYIENIIPFKGNIEITTIKTYGYTRGIGDAAINSSISFQLNTSIVLLPENTMQQRFEDIRVGYFPFYEMDFNQNPQGVKSRGFIRRWRLVPRPGDEEKYKRGELVEPQKPIVFYIDPATPSQWIPYLIQGVNDWNQAFEQAGFKNAIIGKVAPTKAEDSTWSLNDAAHSVIVYKPSDIENAAGYSISDPRTGEILESHISWYHNIMQLLHDQYFIACAGVDSNARKMRFDDTLMGKLIRYAIAHEVGHAIGLLHNMGASSTVAVDSLRNNSWVEKNGVSPSIMDYARFNYVAQPGDRMTEKGLIAQIGAYDRWAVEWGYKWLPQFNTPEQARLFLSGWVSEKMKDKRLWFASEHSYDPRSQKGDLGDDAVKASTYGIKNLRYILPRLEAWSRTPGESYQNLNDMYNVFQSQYIKYIEYVTANIGGTYETIKFSDEGGSIYRPVPKLYQKKAMDFVNEYLIRPPVWILDTAILAKTGQTGLGVMGGLNNEFIDNLLGMPLTMYSIESRNESTFGEDTYKLIDFLDELKKFVWAELYTHKPITLYRRNLQERYLKYIIPYLVVKDRALKTFVFLPISRLTELFPSDAIEMLRGQLYDIQELSKKELRVTTDKITEYHLKYVIDQIELLRK